MFIWEHETKGGWRHRLRDPEQVLLLSLLALLVQKHLLYWYKGTCREAKGGVLRDPEQVLLVVALLVQKYKY
jgi:uncharacterized membrane protein YsdA (DUF1294 family)